MFFFLQEYQSPWGKAILPALLDQRWWTMKYQRTNSLNFSICTLLLQCQMIGSKKRTSKGVSRIYAKQISEKEITEILMGKKKTIICMLPLIPTCATFSQNLPPPHLFCMGFFLLHITGQLSVKSDPPSAVRHTSLGQVISFVAIHLLLCIPFLSIRLSFLACP